MIDPREEVHGILTETNLEPVSSEELDEIEAEDEAQDESEEDSDESDDR
jgi:hypothetical protein